MTLLIWTLSKDKGAPSDKKGGPLGDRTWHLHPVFPKREDAGPVAYLSSWSSSSANDIRQSVTSHRMKVSREGV